MLKKLTHFLVLLVLASVFLAKPNLTLAQDNEEIASNASELTQSTENITLSSTQPLQTYYRAKVEKIVEEQKIVSQDSVGYTQRVQVKRSDNQEVIEVSVGTEFQPLNENQRLRVGSTIILAHQLSFDGTGEYVVADVFRLPALAWLLLGFLVLVLIVARFQGLSSIVGMVISLGVLTLYIVPQILHGANPVVTSLLGAGVIAGITVYLSHGWNAHSHLALGSMMVTLIGVAVLAYMAVHLGQLVGLGSEEAYFLQFGETSRINLQGLLLGGILLGALGILDDICIAQISTVFELRSANSSLGFTELYERGLRVGKDHVASLVNTLVLAYAGSNLPLFLLFTLNKDIPMWVTLNNDIIAEEVVRTLVGSIGLVMAVPVATLLAAYVAANMKVKIKGGHRHAHH